MREAFAVGWNPLENKLAKFERHVGFRCRMLLGDVSQAVQIRVN